jgi:hypothetical protein
MLCYSFILLYHIVLLLRSFVLRCVCWLLAPCSHLRDRLDQPVIFTACLSASNNCWKRRKGGTLLSRALLASCPTVPAPLAASRGQHQYYYYYYYYY